MTQYNTLNVKLSNSQLNKLKSGIKNGSEVTLKILRKAFANNSLSNIKLWKTQLYKIGQLGGFLCRILGPLLKTGLPLMKNVFKCI